MDRITVGVWWLRCQTKMKTLLRLAGLGLVLLGAYHLLLVPVLSTPAVPQYLELVPNLWTGSEGEAVFDAGHALPMALGAIVAWFV